MVYALFEYLSSFTVKCILLYFIILDLPINIFLTFACSDARNLFPKKYIYIFVFSALFAPCIQSLMYEVAKDLEP